MKKLGGFLAVFILLGGFFAWAIGPDWRAFLSNPPLKSNVLFWSQDQRTNTFRMVDKLPFLIKSRTIKAGPNTREFEQGSQLNLSMDFEEYFKNQNHSGLVVVHKGKIRLESYGLGFSKDGRWTSFSVAKSLTSTLVGAALKDGDIKSLDDKVSVYIEGLQVSAYDDVTIKQLLTMTSGVAWNEDYDDPESDVALFSNHKSDDHLLNLVSYMKNLPRAHPPGEVWHYSTGETNLIGVLVAQATGKTLSNYLEEKIWVPYGMQQKATWLIGDDGMEIGGCCVQAATRDFARVGQFIMEGAKIDGEAIVPDDWISFATTKQADIGEEGKGYGYQFWTFDDGSFQANGIFGQSIFIDPNRQLIIASNSSWKEARGHGDLGGSQVRAAFFKAVQTAIDEESNN